MDLPSGIYEHVVTRAIEEYTESLDPESYDTEKIHYEESSEILSRYMQTVIRKGLELVRQNAKKKYSNLSDSKKEFEIVREEIEACNKLIEVLSDISDNENIGEWTIGESARKLLWIWNQTYRTKVRPQSSMSISSLFTGGKQDVLMSDELHREAESADEICFLVSFIRYSGLRLIIDSLERFVQRGGTLKIITTTYMGVTDPKAIERLYELKKYGNIEIKISYDSKNTRLHAKTYLFKRENGYSTAFIGSSNLSNAAISDGMEWNIKVTNQDVPQVLSMISATFDSYWNSSDFEEYTEESQERFKKSLRDNRKGKDGTDILPYHWRPYPYQHDILKDLDDEREIFGSYRNLVVAATGTGKTAVAAFDYKHFLSKKNGFRFLYVVHRVEILEKSRTTFRYILENSDFGEIQGGPHVADNYDHLFITISSLESMNLYDLLPPDYYDYIVADEIHHGAANSYQKLLTYFKPKILLGLTATPERMDNKDILIYFNDRIASEIRLAEAIDRELLVPFHYFMIGDDSVDLSRLTLKNGKYLEEDLNKLFIDNRERDNIICRAVYDYQPDIESIIGMGFCSSVKHAEYMAKVFNENGIKSLAVSRNNNNDTRKNALKLLKSGELKFIFSVDLYNEGIDVPQINTILFLRPTESLTIFIQQLGRGLRLCDGKSELTVLDFVSQGNKRYKMDEKKIKYLTSSTKIPVQMQIKNGFTGLPAGCNLKLDRISQEYILNNIKTGKNELLKAVKEYLSASPYDPNIEEFLEWNNMSLTDFYKKKTGTFTGLCKKAKNVQIDEKLDKLFVKAFIKLSTADSSKWLTNIKKLINSEYIDDQEIKQYHLAMLYYTFYNDAMGKNTPSSENDFLTIIKSDPDYLSEFNYIVDRRMKECVCGKDPNLKYKCGLEVYSSYYRDQILAGLGKSTLEYRYPWREGVLFLTDDEIDDRKNTDVLLISLNKEDKDFSPTTMYEDYAINSELFHWQSQSTTGSDSPAGKRYTDSEDKSHSVILFVRSNKSVDGLPQPYVFLGKGKHVSNHGSKPMTIIWKMENEIPASIREYSPVRE